MKWLKRGGRRTGDSKLWERLLQKYRNMRLFHKLLLLNVILLAAYGFVCILGLEISFSTYDSQLYKKTAQVTGQFFTGIENDLKSVEKFSLSVALDQDVQDQLGEAVDTKDPYRYMVDTENIKAKLMMEPMLEKTLSGIGYVDPNGKMFMVGNGSTQIDSTVLENLIKKAQAAQGEYAFVKPDPQSKLFCTAREIMEYKNLSLRKLGTLVFTMDMDTIVQAHADSFGGDDSSLFILSDGNVIYRSGNETQWDPAEFAESRFTKTGYEILTAHGKKYFAVRVQSSYTHWAYVSVLPYNTIFDEDLLLRYGVMVCILLSFVGSVYLSYRIARHITRPIEDLTVGIQQVEAGNFSRVQTKLSDYNRSDEIGRLQKDFILMANQVDDLIRENYEKQMTIQDTRFRALQAQINPHFLYNTFSSINWLARQGETEKVSEVILALSSLFRAASGDETVVTLEQEAALLNSYVTIQKIRYSDRAKFYLEISPEHCGYRVPKMILQPLVENSIKYGVENMIGECVIRVNSFDDGENIKIMVSDNGPGMDAEFLAKLRKFEIHPKGSGIGLKNIDDRLKMLFGPQYGLILYSESGKGTLVTITIPKGEGKNAQSHPC